MTPESMPPKSAEMSVKLLVVFKNATPLAVANGAPAASLIVYEAV
jgi:hypothetical protein